MASDYFAHREIPGTVASVGIFCIKKVKKFRWLQFFRALSAFHFCSPRIQFHRFHHKEGKPFNDDVHRPNIFGFQTMRPRLGSDSGLSSDSGETYSEGFGEVAPTPEPSLNSAIRERIRHLEQQMINIRAAKAAFSKKFSGAYKIVENLTLRIEISALAREWKLKSQLQEIGKAKILKWDQQLKVCREAEESLNCFRHGTVSILQTIFDTYARRIGFVDAGDIAFDADFVSLLRQLDTFADVLLGGQYAGPVLEKPQKNFTIGKAGRNVGEFSSPWGVCCDASGRIFVADRGNNRVQVFSECGMFLLQFGKSGSGPGEFNRPSGITVDRKGRIIVSDKDNHRIQVFNSDGGFLFCFGRKGTDPGLFQYPWDVAVDGDGNIAVSDTRNSRIQLFDHLGSFLNVIDLSEIVRPPGRKVSPRGIAFRPDGSLMLTDFNNGCVFLVSSDGARMTKWKSWDGHMFRPQGIACDDVGAVAVVDSTRSRVQVFDERGNLLRSFGKSGSNPREFDSLQDVSFQTEGRIVVTELRNNRVQVF